MRKQLMRPIRASIESILLKGSKLLKIAFWYDHPYLSTNLPIKITKNGPLSSITPIIRARKPRF